MTDRHQYRFEVVIEAKTLEDAKTVAIERTNFDERIIASELGADGIIDERDIEYRIFEAEFTDIVPEDPEPHLRAGHGIRVYYDTAMTGFVRWVREGPDDDGWAEVYDDESGDAGPTIEAECGTCGVPLDVELCAELGV